MTPVTVCNLPSTIDETKIFSLFRAYWLPFESEVTSGQHAFFRGTTLEEILLIYDFDRELRPLLLDAIERVEISLRAQLAHSLALKYGPFAHTDSDLFRRRDVWETCTEELGKEYRRSREIFAKHYRNNYNHLELPPIWVACELMALGHISRWLHNLKNPSDRQRPMPMNWMKKSWSRLPTICPSSDTIVRIMGESGIDPFP
jgi:abortive infection bacteriophage resistance protein